MVVIAYVNIHAHPETYMDSWVREAPFPGLIPAMLTGLWFWSAQVKEHMSGGVTLVPL